MTQQQLATAPVVATTAHPETVPVYTRSQVKQLIVREVLAARKGVRINGRRAGKVINILARAMRECRDHGGHYFFTFDELQVAHAILDIIAPDDVEVPASPTGAHAALNTLLLEGDEYGTGFVHTKYHRDGEADAVYCSLYVAVRVATVAETGSAATT